MIAPVNDNRHMISHDANMICGHLTKLQAYMNVGEKFPPLLQVENRISSDSFHGNYSFLHLEIQRSQYLRPKVTVHKGAESIQGRKVFKGGNYMRKYGM